MTSTSVDRLTGLSTGVAIKAPCVVATTANITLSGEQTIDGVAVVSGDRVLVRSQTSGVNNGIYVADTGAWERAQDFNGARDAVTGTLVRINGGTAGQGFWRLTTTGAITIGTTSLAFTLDSFDPSTYVPKAGGTMTGPLILSGAPSTNLQAATKAYVDANTSTLTSLGVSAFMQTVLDDTTSGAARTTLGISDPGVDRNGLFNAAMICVQRGTSFTAITTLRQTLDGWAADSGGGSSMTVSQQAAPSGFGFAFVNRAQRPNGNSGTDNHRLFQVIPSVDCTRFQGQTCTLSYYAKAGANFSAASSNLKVQIVTGTGSDEGSSGYSAATWTGLATPLSNVSQAITSTLTRYSHSVTIASTATEIGAGFFFVPVGTAGAADYFEITGIQLEVGGMTDFAHMPFSRTFERARHFYRKTFPYATIPVQNVGSVVGALSIRNPIANGEPSIFWQFDPPMFKTPTATTYNPSAGNANWRNVTASADVTVETDTAGSKGSTGIHIATSGTVATLGNYLCIHASVEAAI